MSTRERKMRKARVQPAAVDNTDMSTPADAQSTQDTSPETVPPEKVTREGPKEGPRAPSISNAQARSDAYNASIKEATRNITTLYGLEEGVNGSYKQLAENETNHKEFKSVVEAKQATIEGSISRLESGSKDLPTFKTVTRLVEDESKARERALSEAVSNIPEQISTCVSTDLDNFRHAVLEPVLADEMAPVTKRVEDLETSLQAEKDFLVNIKELLEQRPGLEELQASVVSEVEKKIIAANLTVSQALSTQFKAQIETCTSNLENVIIPQLLNPLKQKIDGVEAVCAFTKTKLLDLHQKQAAGNESRFKDLEKNLIDRLKKEVDTVRQEFSDREAAYNKDKDLLTGSVDALRKELHVERDARKEAEKNSQDILRRLQDMEREQADAKDGYAKYEERQRQSRAQIAARHLNLENTVRRQLQEHEEAIRANAVSAHEDVQSKMHQHLRDVMWHVDRFFDAYHIEHLPSRVEILEAANSQQHCNHGAEVDKIQTELAVVKKFAADVAASTRNISKHVDSIGPMSTDLDHLKDQHRDLVENYKARIQEQASITAAHTKSLRMELEGRIQSQQVALQEYLFEAHNIIDGPVVFQQQTHTYQLLRTVEAGLAELANRFNGFLETDFTNAALRADSFEQRINILNIQVSQLEAQGRKRSVRRESHQLT